MPVSITPILSSSEGYLTDVRDQVVVLLRFMIMNPGGTSDLWENDLISFRTISSANESSRDKLTAALSNRLTTILSRKFADYNFDVECSSEDYDESENTGRYTVGIDILINTSSGQLAAVINGSIFVDKKTNQISLKFSDSIDNQTLY